MNQEDFFRTSIQENFGFDPKQLSAEGKEEEF